MNAIAAARNPLSEAIASAMAPLPSALLEYQAEWLADDALLKVAEKSRRIGLTWAEAADNVLTAALSVSAGGQNVYYIGYNMDMAIEYVDACAKWAKYFSKACGEIEEGEEIFKDEKDEEHRIKTYTIKFPSGFRIVALSSRPANLRGKQGVVVIDEAAFHNDLGELIKAAMALLIWGGRVRIISTHDGDDNPFNELINEIRAGKRLGSVHRIEFKEAVRQGLFRRVQMRKGEAWSQEAEDKWVEGVYKFYGDDATEELDVVPSSGEGAYLPRTMILNSQRDIPVLRLSCKPEFTFEPEHIRRAVVQDWLDNEVLPHLKKLNKNLRHHYGLDFARINDLCSFWPIQQQPNMSYETPFLIELRNVPYEQQKQIVKYIVRRLPRFMGGAHDATGNGGYLAEVMAQEFGPSRIAQVKITAGWYIENMPKMKAHFEDQTITTPRDANTFSDLRSIRKIAGVPKVGEQTQIGTDGLPRHGDSAIALVMACFAAATLVAGEIDYIPVPRHPRGFDNIGDGSIGDLEDIQLPEPTGW